MLWSAFVLKSNYHLLACTSSFKHHTGARCAVHVSQVLLLSFCHRLSSVRLAMKMSLLRSWKR